MAACLGRSSGNVNHAARREIAKSTVVSWYLPRRAVGDTPVRAVDPREAYTQTIAVSLRNTTLAGNGSLDFEQRLGTRNISIVHDRTRDGVTFPGCEKEFLNRKHTLLIVTALQWTFEGEVQVPAPVDVFDVCLGNRRTSWKDNVSLLGVVPAKFKVPRSSVSSWSPDLVRCRPAAPPSAVLVYGFVVTDEEPQFGIAARCAKI